MNAKGDKCKVVVLISSGGSNLQSIIDHAEQSDSPFEIKAVISNKPNAGGLERAKKHNIDQVTLDHTKYPSREAFDDVLAKTIEGYQPDLVVLAGFMRILTSEFVSQFIGKLLNIHPSLLPKYPGLHTHQRALDAKDSHAGCTVHFVSEELDGGPAIIQAQTNIEHCTSADEIAQQVLTLEHKIYPLAVEWFASKRLVQQNNHSILDGNQLPPSGYLYTQA